MREQGNINPALEVYRQAEQAFRQAIKLDDSKPEYREKLKFLLERIRMLQEQQS